jgi:hypothetical protein
VEKRLNRIWPWVTRLFGLGIVFWQVAFNSIDRPYLLLLAGGMMGIEPVKKIQDALSKNNDKG